MYNFSATHSMAEFQPVGKTPESVTRPKVQLGLMAARAEEAKASRGLHLPGTKVG
jgi:hypothetical protein